MSVPAFFFLFIKERKQTLRGIEVRFTMVSICPYSTFYSEGLFILKVCIVSNLYVLIFLIDQHIEI